MLKSISPLVLFDNTYFIIAYFYEKTSIYNVQKEEIGIFVLSIFQSLNLISLLFFTGYIDILFNILPKKFAFFPLMIIFAVINFIRYRRNFKYSILKNKWVVKDNKSKAIPKYSVIAYAVFSILLFAISVNLK